MGVASSGNTMGVAADHHFHFHWPPTDAYLAARLDAIDKKLEKIMTDQETVNAAAAQLESTVQVENAALARIQAQIAQLQANQQSGQPLDFTALNQAVADAGAAGAAEDAVVPAAPAEPAADAEPAS
jgi:hypothetical protein